MKHFLERTSGRIETTLLALTIQMPIIHEGTSLLRPGSVVPTMHSLLTRRYPDSTMPWCPCCRFNQLVFRGGVA